VKWAGNCLTVHNALAQWPTFVGAAVEQSKHFVFSVAKNRNFMALDAAHASCAEHGDVFHLTDNFPFRHLVFR
jgi:hypothetical protein